MKRILIIQQDAGILAPGHDAGVISKRLVQRGHDVVRQVLVSPSRDVAAAMPPETGLEQIVWPHRYLWSSWQQIRTGIRRFQPDEIHVWGTDSSWISAIVSTMRRCPVKQVVACSARKPASMSRWLAADRHAGGIIPVVRHGKLAKTLVGQSRVVRAAQVLPWFRYPDSPAGPTRDDIRHRLDIPADAHFVVAAAPLVPQTALKDFVWAGDLLRCVRDDVYWMVLGSGRQSWRLRRFAGQLEIGDRLRFCDDRLAPADIMKAADILVQPSDWYDDYCGLRAAISRGMPAIGLSQTIHDELISHHRTGFLVERGARNEIARCVNRLVSRPDIADEMGALADRGQRLASLDEAVDSLLEIRRPSPAAVRRTGGSSTSAGI